MTKYVVSIKGTNGRYRSCEETTLSACVQLTIGLTAKWIIEEKATAYLISGDENNTADRPFWIKYQHAVRSCICSWVNREAKKSLLTKDDRDQLRFAFRMKDANLLCFLKQKKTDPIIIAPYTPETGR